MAFSFLIFVRFFCLFPLRFYFPLFLSILLTKQQFSLLLCLFAFSVFVFIFFDLFDFDLISLIQLCFLSSFSSPCSSRLLGAHAAQWHRPLPLFRRRLLTPLQPTPLRGQCPASLSGRGVHTPSTGVRRNGERGRWRHNGTTQHTLPYYFILLTERPSSVGLGNF